MAGGSNLVFMLSFVACHEQEFDRRSNVLLRIGRRGVLGPSLFTDVLSSQDNAVACLGCLTIAILHRLNWEDGPIGVKKMPVVRKDEVFSFVHVNAGPQTMNRRIHRHVTDYVGKGVVTREGKKLPHSVVLYTEKNEKGENINVLRETIKPDAGTEFSATALFFAMLVFIALCTYVVVKAVEASSCSF